MAFDFGTANDMQKEAIKTTEGPLLIIAGPGTGKTHTLVQRIVYLIQEKSVKPEEIMVATFTDKAAKELITRITNELLKKNIKVKTIKGSKKNIYTGTTVMTCSSKQGYDDWHKNVFDFIKTLKDSGKLTDYNQVAFLCRSVTNDKILNLINYLEDNGINVYSPRSEIYFERLEIRQIIGCMLLCFPAYEKRMKAKTFDYNPENLFNYFEEKCLPAAEQMAEEYPDTLGKFISEVRKRHANLQENTDYAFTGLLYQFLEFEPFASLVDVGIGTGVIDERPARNLSIFSGLLGKFEFIERLEVFSPEKIEHASTEFFTKFLRVMIEDGIDEYEDDSEYAPKGCVSFMTIHQSKGMEFPVVIVGSMNQKPGSDKDNIMSSIAEKYFQRKPFEDKINIPNYDFWRLYYTAFSRAQNLLVLSGKEMAGAWACPSKYFANMYNKLPDWRSVDVANIDFELVKPVNIKETYSFTSHIAVYENCALQYKYFKELGFTQVRVGSTLFGTLVHETIEDVHRAAMRHEEYTITPDNVRYWLDTNYQTLSKSEHAYLGPKQVDAAYNQVMRYIERATSGSGGGIVWSHIQEAEVEVSLVKEDYILKGQIDLIRGDGETVEIVDFKSEKVPEMDDEMLNRYRRQLEIYAYLVEQRDHKKVSKMHLYYTGEDEKSPMVTFNKSEDSIEVTIKEFDDVVSKIQKRDFTQKACNKKLCRECDFRYHCGEVKKK